MQKFSTIYNRALKRKGGEKALKLLLPSGILDAKELKRIPDDRYLSVISMAVFKAGFVWRVIDNKWPEFEKAFWGFNLRRCAAISSDDVDQLCKNEKIVRNAKKIQAVQKNAYMVSEFAREYGSFARMVAEWPAKDFIGLCNRLKKHGDRMGLQTTQYFLRTIGKDGFIFSADVIAALIAAGLVDKNPTGKKAQEKVQQAFDVWREQSGLGNAYISRVLALSIDA